jgi:non-specific protein-tyrosine kinase
MANFETPNMLMSEEEESIDFRRYLGLLRRWWWLFILAALVAGAIGYYYSLQLTPIYQATTTMMINEAPTSTRSADLTSITTSERLARTYAKMITTRPMIEKVIQRLGVVIPPDQVAGMVNVIQVSNSQLLTITVQGPDGNFSAAVANALVVVFSEQLQEQQSTRYAASKKSLEDRVAEVEKQITDLQDQVSVQRSIVERKQLAAEANNTVVLSTDADVAELDRMESRLDQFESIRTNLVLSYEQVRLAEAQSYSNVVQIEPAEVPASPISPEIMQNTLMAALIGLMLSGGGVFVYDLLDDTIKSPDEVRRQTRLNILGTIANFDEPDDGQLITEAQPRSPVTEAFRSLRTNLQYASISTPLRTLLVTSPAPADGKTTVVSNLSMVMAHSGRKVTVMDADMHRPRVHLAFKQNLTPGLSSLFIRPDIHLNGSLQSTSSDRLKTITAGELPPNPSELLGSNKMREILNAIQETADLVIVDSPPVLSVTDAVVLAPIVDGVVLVVRPGVTRMNALKYAVEQLRYVGANLLGVVINRVNDRSARYGYYYKSYYYKQYKYYSSNGKPVKRKSGDARKQIATQPVDPQSRN